MNSTELYQKVVALHEQGFGSRRIAKILDVNSKSFERWIYPKGTLCKPRPNPDLIPCPELAYLLGVLLSDGFLYKDVLSRKYVISLRAKDKDFVEEFRRCLLKVSKRKVCLFKCKDGLWQASCSCKKLYEFLDDKLAHCQTINYNLDFFIRGFADGDGCATIFDKKYGYVNVTMYNSNLPLLFFIQKLLEVHFDIFAKIRKHTWSEKTRKQPYRLGIHRQVDVAKYAKFVGFHIKRKRDKVNCSLEIASNMLEKARLYEKAWALHNEGLGYRRIAKKLNINENTVASWISRGHKPWASHQTTNFGKTDGL